MKATIYSIDEDGAERVLTVYTVEKGTAVGGWAKGVSDHLRKQLELDGAYDHKGVLRYPKDGEKFIKALEFNFANSSRITARIT